MSTPQYFAGEPENMGRVSRLPAATFLALVETFLSKPVAIAMTRDELLALPEAEQNAAKRTRYIVPCAFKESPSPRQTGKATEAHLACIDIDDSVEARRILNAGFDKTLGDLNAVVWHTARSTEDKPRIRVIVQTLPVPVARYGAVVTAVAGLLGMNSLNKESRVAVQPMYLPVEYRDADLPAIVHKKTDGVPFDPSGIEGLTDLPTGGADLAAEADMGDLAYLRPPVEGLTEARVREILRRIPASCSMQQWVEVGMALKHQFGEAGFAIWDDWSSTSPEKYDGTEKLVSRWNSMRQNPPDRVPVTIRSVFRIAGIELPPDPRLIEQCARDEQRGDALLLSYLARDQLLYDHTAKLWRTYNAGVWNLDHVRGVRAAAKPVIADPYLQQAMKISREITEDLKAGRLDANQVKKDPREVLRRVLQGKIARLNQRKYIDDVLHLAGDFLPCRTEELDREPHLLNLTNGTLDLKSGSFREHDPRDKLSKQAAVEYRPEAQCPKWCAFLDTVFDGDREKVEFLRRTLGYTLSGETDHDFLVFCLGSGRNGKSTLLQIPQVLLGDYFTTLPIEAILSQSRGQRDNQASAELARLHGARMALSSEIPEGRKLNESVVKDISAGDLITARMLYANPFSFKPTHKLWLMGNHKPEIMGVDEGIWRRIYLLTFNHSFPKSGEPGFRERKEVVDELLTEGPGILNWLRKGCDDIRAKGLNPPDSVRFQTNEYREESDPLAEFIAEHCVVGPGHACKSHDIWEAYFSYTAGAPRAYSRQRALTNALAQRGYKPGRNKKSRMIDGISVLNPEERI